MSNIEHKEVVIQPGASKSTCQIFIFDLPASVEAEYSNEPSPGGKIFGIIEVELPPSRKINLFINNLIGELKNQKNYRDVGSGAESVFEKLIQKINYRYLDLIGNKSTFGEESLSVPKINAVLAMEAEKNIYLAQKGKIFPFLIYRAKHQNYKIINIAESATGKEGRGNINLFTNIINGKINDNDHLIFLTESLLDYFSLEKICRTVSELPPKEAAENLNSLLLDSANPKTSFAAIILKFSLEEDKKISLNQNQNQEKISVPQSSMETLLKTAHNTEKVLTPSLRLNIGSGLTSFFQKIKKTRSEKKQIRDKARLEYHSSQFTPPNKIQKIVKPITWFLIAVARFIYLIIGKIFLLFFKILKIIFIPSARKKSLEEKSRQPEQSIKITENFRENKEEVKNKQFKTGDLKKSSKILLIFAAVAIMAFIAGTTSLYFKYKKEARAESLRKKIEMVQNKKNAAEASLIYKDEIGAGKILDEAENLLSSFPQNTAEEKNAYENILKDIVILREKIRRYINIENPFSIINFSDHSPEINISEFIIAGNNLYAFDQNSSVVYKINFETGEIIAKNAPGIILTMGFMEKNDSAIFYQPEKKLFKFDLRDEILKERSIVFHEEEKRVDDFAIYNQNIYILDSAAGQIFKHAPTETGYSRGMPWIKDGTNANDAASLMINGSIYITRTTGEIVKMDKGYRADFTQFIDPPLLGNSKSWTSPESSFLYILDRDNKRIVILDKDGKLKAQYISDKFKDPRDFFIAENKKEIYILSENQIYKFPADHLQ